MFFAATVFFSAWIRHFHQLKLNDQSKVETSGPRNDIEPRHYLDDQQLDHIIKKVHFGQIVEHFRDRPEAYLDLQAQSGTLMFWSF